MKKNLKKFLGLLLAVTMVISMLSACSKDNTTKTDATAPTATSAPAVATATPVPTEPPKDLGGLDIKVANWWEADPPAAPANQKEEDTLKYRQDIMDKYNFKIKNVNIGGWGEFQEIVVSSIMAGAPAADVFVMDQSFMAAPLSQGLLYPLDTLSNFDFSQDKWNQQIKDLMTMNGHVYGMSASRSEPRLGIFWNKRLFEEAGLSPDLPYDLQAKGEWTWDKFKEIAKQLTRDTNSDGTPDTYGLASFSVDFFRGCVFSNNAKFVGKDDKGFFNATGDANFLEALQWGRSVYDEGYVMPQPEGSNWDWFISAFHDGKVAMQCAEEYKVNNWADMSDDWGFVIFPKGPQGEMMTVFADNIVVMPAGVDAAKADNIAFAYNLFTNPTPGYENDDWKTDYYPKFRDSRAVDETLPLFYDPKHGTMSYLPLIAGLSYGDVCYDLDAGQKTPQELVEKVQQQWQTYIDTANGVKTTDATATTAPAK
ncbi:MAG TPA: extracellular solute-binding protein [Mobilitalea sp.]|nr:extracellular solute-binding protein [Mobilitalea sp.]